MRLDAFMGRANRAYYATQDPFADFVTSAEISQAFGEVLGAWAVTGWAAMGAPDPVVFTEMGPGRGTMMADAQRLIRRLAPEFDQAQRLHLIENSPRLRTIQAANLRDAQAGGAVWKDVLAELPDGPLILLANEFLDALPIRQFVRRGASWTERHVVDGRPVEHPAAAGPYYPAPRDAAMGGALPEGAVVEVGDAAVAWVAELAARLATQGGMALILDYGPAESAAGNSLQALRDGRPADPFAAPGRADLTAHVDFAAIARAARAAGAAVHGPVPQGPFLVQLGMFQRIHRLARGVSARRADALIAAGRRLVEPDQMGRLFKALAICHPALPVPAGFEA